MGPDGRPSGSVIPFDGASISDDGTEVAFIADVPQAGATAHPWSRGKRLLEMRDLTTGTSFVASSTARDVPTA